MSDADESPGAAACAPRCRPPSTNSVAVFMISVAAELAEMHPQTLRMYEARGLITPKRSPKNTRLYSFDDVERLRRIQRMTAEEGLNLAGVETVLGARAPAGAGAPRAEPGCASERPSSSARCWTRSSG